MHKPQVSKGVLRWVTAIMVAGGTGWRKARALLGEPT